MSGNSDTWWSTTIALLVSLALLTAFFASTGNSSLEVFHSIYRGAFGSWFSWQDTLVRAAPLMLTALCTALPARVGLIVIGGEGAMIVGGLAAAVVGLGLQNAPPLLVLTGMFSMAALAGGAWIAAVGALKQYRAVNETISSLLLNYIAAAILMFLVVGVLKDPASLNHPATRPIGEANMIGAMGDSTVHWGLALSVSVCLVLWLLARHSVFGFAADITGGNQRAARLAGLPVGRIVVVSCLLGGAAAGLAGAVEVAAVHGRANAALIAGYGYAGILVAFLARHNPLAIIPFALLLGGIQASGGLLQRAHDLPDATVLVVQGIIFMSILVSDAVAQRWPWRRPRFKAAKAAMASLQEPAGVQS